MNQAEHSYLWAEWTSYVCGRRVADEGSDIHRFSHFLARQTIPIGGIDRCDSAEEGALVSGKVSPANDACNFSCITGQERLLTCHTPPSFWGAGCPAAGEPVGAFSFASLSPVIVLA